MRVDKKLMYFSLGFNIAVLIILIVALIKLLFK